MSLPWAVAGAAMRPTEPEARDLTRLYVIPVKEAVAKWYVIPANAGIWNRIDGCLDR